MSFPLTHSCWLLFTTRSDYWCWLPCCTRTGRRVLSDHNGALPLHRDAAEGGRSLAEGRSVRGWASSSGARARDSRRPGTESKNGMYSVAGCLTCDATNNSHFFPTPKERERVSLETQTGGKRGWKKKKKRPPNRTQHTADRSLVLSVLVLWSFLCLYI